MKLQPEEQPASFSNGSSFLVSGDMPLERAGPTGRVAQFPSKKASSREERAHDVTEPNDNSSGLKINRVNRVNSGISPPQHISRRLRVVKRHRFTFRPLQIGPVSPLRTALVLLPAAGRTATPNWAGARNGAVHSRAGHFADGLHFVNPVPVATSGIRSSRNTHFRVSVGQTIAFRRAGSRTASTGRPAAISGGWRESSNSNFARLSFREVASGLACEPV